MRDGRSIWLWSLALLGAVLIVHGFTLPIVGDDAWIHLAWLDQFHALQKQGVEYPRWLVHSYGGFGSPSFYFYPPLPYFLGSGIQFVSGLSFAGLYQVITFIGTALSAYTGYYYLRVLGFEKIASVAAAGFYAFAPYRFVDLYARSALGEHFSFIFLPLLLASIDLALRAHTRDSKLHAIVIAALGAAGVVLTNIPATVMFAIVVAMYALLRARKNVRTLWMPIVGSLLALLICAMYLIPVFELREHTQMNHIFDIGSLEQRWSFIILELFQAPLTVARILNATTLLLGIAALCYAIVERKKEVKYNHAVSTALVLLGVSLFFQIPGIAALFYQITPIDLIKYSWRWNVVLTLALATCMGLAYQREKPGLVIAIGLAAIGLTLAMSFRFASENATHRPYESLREIYMDAPEYVPIHAPKEYYDVVRFGEVNKHAPPVIYDRSAGKITLLRRGPERLVYSVELAEPRKAILHQFYWPQWQLWREDYSIELGYDEYGRAVADLDVGSYQVELRLVPTTGQTVGGWLSGLGAILLIGCIALSMRSTAVDK